jgi:hypothetical protein
LPGQLDPELPQRRVTQFAAQRNIPVIDLLPVFRSSQQAVYLPNRAEMSDHGIQLAVDVVGSWLLARYGSELASAQSAAGPAVVP